jgi:hypothetical protein
MKNSFPSDSGRLLSLVIGIGLAGSAAVANLCGVGAGPAIGIAILLGVALCLASLGMAPGPLMSFYAYLALLTDQLPSGQPGGPVQLDVHSLSLVGIMIVITEQYPASLYEFQCGVLRWQARLLGYHASLVEQAPPWRFDAGSAPTA